MDAGPLTIMVAVANEGRGVIAPCGRCRQAIVDLHPDCVIIVPGADGPESMPVAELLPFAFRHPDGAADRVVRFDDSRYDPVEQGLITATIRYRDPVDVGPALFIFDNDDGYRRLPGLIESVEAVPLEALSPEHARRGGASSVEHLRQGLARRHPGISGRDVVDFVRFQVRGS